RVRRVDRPPIAHPPVGGELEVVEVVLAAGVVQEVDDGQREVRRIQVEGGDRRRVRGERAVGLRDANRYRYVVRADRPVQVVALIEPVDPPPDEARVHADVREQLALDE